MSNSSKITIVDYGMGNLASIKNMLAYIGVDSEITSDPAIISKATKIILPGVGAFDNGMENLAKMKILPVINDLVLKKKIPVLGICLGMQLMTRKSEEGKLPGLGWIEASTVKFNFPTDTNLRIPHMGWNEVKIKKDHPVIKDLPTPARYYFVHSYHAVCDNPKDVLLEADYGYDFCAAFARDNIIGVQFHPEKSHKFGMKLLENFAKM